MTLRKLSQRDLVKKIKVMTAELFVARQLEGNKPKRVWKA